MTGSIDELATQLWTLVGDDGGLGRLEVTGARHVLPSAFDVTGLATASVGVATAAVAGFVAARTGRPRRRAGRHPWRLGRVRR